MSPLARKSLASIAVAIVLVFLIGQSAKVGADSKSLRDEGAKEFLKLTTSNPEAFFYVRSSRIISITPKAVSKDHVNAELLLDSGKVESAHLESAKKVLEWVEQNCTDLTK